MHSFYNPVFTKIKTAVEKNDWDEVNKLYTTQPIGKRNAMDNIIYKTIIKKLDSLDADKITDYLLLAMTLAPSVITKQRVFFYLLETPQYAKYANISKEKTIAELSTDIFSTMYWGKCNYEDALKQLNACVSTSYRNGAVC